MDCPPDRRARAQCRGYRPVRQAGRLSPDLCFCLFQERKHSVEVFNDWCFAIENCASEPLARPALGDGDDIDLALAFAAAVSTIGASADIRTAAEGIEAAPGASMTVNI